MNRRMKEFLRMHPHCVEEIHGKQSVSRSLQTLLRAGVVRKNGGIFLKALLSKSGNAQPADFPDMTGYECFINHIHLDDRLGKGASAFEQAILFGRQVRDLLSRHVSAGSNVKVIVSCSGDGCSVRFHLVRENEKWLSEKLDSYAEAILILETAGQSSQVKGVRGSKARLISDRWNR